MPDSLASLVAFVVLLAPGFLYIWRREALVPRASPSTFRETVEVVLASVASGLVAVAVFAIIRTALPEATPDVGRLVREGHEYVQDDYRRVASWAVGLVILACAFALWAGGPKTRAVRLAGRLRRTDWQGTGQVRISPRSRWWEMFCDEVGPGERVWVSCTLEDGTYLAGALGPFSTATDETENRELVLVGPVDYRGPGDEQITTLGDGSVIVSAKRILYLGVAYLPMKGVEAPVAQTPSMAPEGATRSLN